MTPDQLRVADRITAYLSGGGLFNPELANHDAVRDLLIDARDAHAAAMEEIERLNAAWKAQQFHLEAEERESAHWQERAEQAERRAEHWAEKCEAAWKAGDELTMQRMQADRRVERLKGHAEAMARTIATDSASHDALYLYRREFKEE